MSSWQSAIKFNWSRLSSRCFNVFLFSPQALAYQAVNGDAPQIPVFFSLAADLCSSWQIFNCVFAGKKFLQSFYFCLSFFAKSTLFFVAIKTAGFPAQAHTWREYWTNQKKSWTIQKRLRTLFKSFLRHVTYVFLPLGRLCTRLILGRVNVARNLHRSKVRQTQWLSEERWVDLSKHYNQVQARNTITQWLTSCHSSGRRIAEIS